MSPGFLRRVDWATLDAESQSEALQRPAVRAGGETAAQVERLIAEVRREGDRALRRFTAALDGVAIGSLRVTEQEAEEAAVAIGPAAVAAIRTAIDNVSRFHAAQVASSLRVETAPGVVCERVVRPIRAVGLYVPAGSAPLPSTAIMLAIPARIAGCVTRIMCTPPRHDGRADPAVVAAAWECGVRDIFKVGGAQAIAAMAYGTESIPKVEKVFGPGNAWVTAAKQAVALDPAGAALDMPAGPSEVMVVADAGANPRWVALDLLSQAEHGPDSHVVLVTTHAGLINEVEREMAAALPALSRRSIIERALTHGAAIAVSDLRQAMEVANSFAPEHLILQVAEPRRCVEQVQSAGSVFLGAWTPESVGDYCSGTNHVLPTYGYARAYSGLGVADFQRRMTLQELTPDGLAGLAPVVATLAGLEGLDAHAEAVRVRVEAAGRA
jgi:histidinol dehydrogenase